MNFISNDYLLAISDGPFFDMVNHDTEENDKGRRSPSVQTVRHQALLVTSLSVYSNTIFNIIKMKLLDIRSNGVTNYFDRLRSDCYPNSLNPRMILRAYCNKYF